MQRRKFIRTAGVGAAGVAGFDPTQPELGRIARFESMRKQRWARPEALAAARRYNALARAHGPTPKWMHAA